MVDNKLIVFKILSTNTGIIQLIGCIKHIWKIYIKLNIIGIEWISKLKNSEDILIDILENILNEDDFSVLELGNTKTYLYYFSTFIFNLLFDSK